MRTLHEAIQRHRAHTCSVCPTPCAQQHDPAAHANPCAACPLTTPRWEPWDCVARSAGDPDPMRGLGDAVAVVAQPIARLIDRTSATLGRRTNVAGCGACKKRQEALNEALPFT